MNRDDVLRMAVEVGAGTYLPAEVGLPGTWVGQDFDMLERFAALVAADARAARIAAQTENEVLKARLAASGVAERRAVREAVLAEREACALECEEADSDPHVVLHVGTVCADAIRARGAA